MRRLPTPREIADAPTYADALEKLNGISRYYRVKPDTPNPWPSIFNLFIFSLVAGPVFIYLCSTDLFDNRATLFLSSGITATIAILILILTEARKPQWVLLRQGTLTIQGSLFFAKKINLIDIRWIGSFGSRRYIFTTRGRRVSLPAPQKKSSRILESRLFSLLFELAKMRVREDAFYLSESGPGVRLPLSQWATFRRVPFLLLGLLFPAPMIIILLYVAWAIALFPRGKPLLIISLFSYPFAATMMWLFIKGWKRFLCSYGFRKEIFTRDGLLLGRKRLIPYDTLMLRLYRAPDRIEVPIPGILEIVLPEGKTIFMGPERENYFTLPYVLRKWAPRALEILPTMCAPARALRMQFKDQVWIPGDAFEESVKNRNNLQYPRE
ncbi:MAG: hypothetical protein E3J72_12560 [Planctomycetota bacterium]|nr:MAG: hypothetical protein E3J72_12560 [Planctomycetota bacterium]